MRFTDFLIFDAAATANESESESDFQNLYSKTSANRLPHVVLIALQSVQDVVGISAKSCCREIQYDFLSWSIGWAGPEAGPLNSTLDSVPAIVAAASFVVLSKAAGRFGPCNLSTNWA
jgi:hypothetical protein